MDVHREVPSGLGNPTGKEKKQGKGKRGFKVELDFADRTHKRKIGPCRAPVVGRPF